MKTIKIDISILPTLCGVVLVLLKLFKIIDWSWWYISIPFFIYIAIIFLGCIAIYLYYGIKLVLEKRKLRRYYRKHRLKVNDAMKIHKLSLWKYTLWIYTYEPKGYLNDFSNKLLFKLDLRITKILK